MHMIFQSQSSPILPLAYRAIFTNFYRVDFNNFCFFCAKQAYKKHVFENCICSCTFYYYILSKLLSNLALGHNYIEKSENTNWCQKASSVGVAQRTTTLATPILWTEGHRKEQHNRKNDEPLIHCRTSPDYYRSMKTDLRRHLSNAFLLTNNFWVDRALSFCILSHRCAGSGFDSACDGALRA